VTGRLSKTALASSFLRSFLIQGSWNYRTMIGCGFAFAMIPGLRRIFGADPGAMDEALERHVQLFNAHPYLSGVALGASLRLERDGAEGATVERFKVAVRGPLGSLGDALVWAAWLPAVSALALSVYWLGGSTLAVVALFLVLYNLGHVGLRLWGFVVGFQDGREVGQRLARAALTAWTERLKVAGTLLLGVLAGALLAGDRGLAVAGAPWVAAAAAAFVVGLMAGHRAWRPAAAAVVGSVILLSFVGILR